MGVILQDAAYISNPRFLHGVMFSVGSGDLGVEAVPTTWNYAGWQFWLPKGIDSFCISLLGFL